MGVGWDSKDLWVEDSSSVVTESQGQRSPEDGEVCGCKQRGETPPTCFLS